MSTHFSTLKRLFTYNTQFNVQQTGDASRLRVCLEDGDYVEFCFTAGGDYIMDIEIRGDPDPAVLKDEYDAGYDDGYSEGHADAKAEED